MSTRSKLTAGAGGYRIPPTSGEALLQDADVTFVETLAVYIGAAAPESDLNQLSRTLRRLRRHVVITADRARPAGRHQTWTASKFKKEDQS